MVPPVHASWQVPDSLAGKAVVASELHGVWKPQTSPREMPVLPLTLIFIHQLSSGHGSPRRPGHPFCCWDLPFTKCPPMSFWLVCTAHERPFKTSPMRGLARCRAAELPRSDIIRCI